MNTKRILLGGLVAGVVMNVIDGVINGLVLAPRYTAMSEAGLLLSEPRLPFMPLWVLLVFTMGLVVAWLYAIARPRLGPGPKTAILVALAVGFAWGVPTNFSMANWATFGRFLPFMWCVSAFLESIAGTLVAGALYKEPS